MDVHPGQAPLCIIIDALDEFPNSYDMPSPREKVLKFVEELVDLLRADLRICIMSQPEADIVDHIMSVVNTVPKMKR